MPCGNSHFMPHAEQLAGSTRSADSHPSAALWLQSPKPERQVPGLHTPPTHVGVWFCAAHAISQAPQFFRSVADSTHCPAQHFFVPPPQRASSLQPAVHTVVPSASSLHTLPTGQSPSARHAAHLFL